MHWLTILLISAGLGLPGPSACPDFTGRHVMPGQDGRVFSTLAQRGCATIHIEWAIHSNDGSSVSVHDVALDGRFHRDRAWFGAPGYQLTSAVIHEGTLDLAARPLAAKDTAAIDWRLRFRLLPDGDLCSGFREGRNGEWSADRAGANQGEGSDAIATAAARAETGCPPG